MEYTEEELQKIIKSYKLKRQREQNYYHNVSKNDENFKIKNRQRAKNHYDSKGKEMKKNNYNQNKEFMQYKSLYNYYKKNNKLEHFKELHPIKYKFLFEKGFIN